MLVDPFQFKRQIIPSQTVNPDEVPLLGEQWMRTIGLTKSSTRDQVTGAVNEQISEQGDPPISLEFRGKIVDYTIAVLKGTLTQAHEQSFREDEQREYGRAEMQAWLES